MHDRSKLTCNIDLIRQAMKEIGPDIPSECRTSYVEAMADIAYIQGYCQIPESMADLDGLGTVAGSFIPNDRQSGTRKE